MRGIVPVLCGVLLASGATAAAAQDTEWNRYTLEELGGVFVRAESDEACQSAGMSDADVRLHTESLLAMSEVDMLTEGEMLRNPGLPELRITLDCTAAEGGAAGTLAFAVSVRVQQSVQMIRDTQITLSEAVTWYSHGLGVAPTGEAADALETALTERVEAFATAYLAANDEESPDPGPR